MAAPAAPLKVLRRLDYAPVAWTTRRVSLDFDIREGATRVRATLRFARNAAAAPGGSVALNRGHGVELVSIALDGAPLAHALTDKLLTFDVPAAAAAAGEFELLVETRIEPEKNTALEGLYRSTGTYCTQCEAEGFRSITFFQDRPDVMAVWRVRVEADRAACPVLLSNGNLVEKGAAADPSRHFAVYEDPWPKPCYLFALVAGDLAETRDAFTTRSGRAVSLRIYTAARDADKVGWAMESLKRAMKWDEDKFGLEYDLDLFNIVAVPDFNMGAMENKSLNVFNSRLVLASTRTASDLDFNRIEGVVAHEYFHNWTGDRVTCKDWFQLTLKEGLTVFRDQSFTADVNSRPIKRIEDVLRLRQSQFAEDAGPTAHPIRPDEVGKMDNFCACAPHAFGIAIARGADRALFLLPSLTPSHSLTCTLADTATVYEKGAEIIRIYETVLGVAGFRKGMDLYFARHDGQAVDCDAFFQAMFDANEGHVGQAALPALKRWYSQAGTPELTVTPTYDAAARMLTLACAQRTPPTAGQATKEPVLVPIAVGLVGADGRDLPLVVDGRAEASTTAVLCLTEAARSYVFSDVPAGAVPSVLRGFSAPVRLTVVGQTDAQLTHLLAHDSDSFNRYEAGQVLGRSALLAYYDVALAQAADARPMQGLALPASLVEAFRSLLRDASLDGAIVARSIALPAEVEIVDALAARGVGADPVLVHKVREWAVSQLASRLQPELEAAMARAEAEIVAAEAKSGGYSPNFAAVARRALRNRCLYMLSRLEAPAAAAAAPALVLTRFKAATNMTDQVAALAALVELPGAERDEALAAFAAQFSDEPLVMLKWLALQAGSSETASVAGVRALMAHASFSITNPNCCYSLFGPFASTPAFHAADGSGYAFLGEIVRQLDAVNPQVASRIVSAFSKLGQYDAVRRALMLRELEALAAHAGLSENVGEIVARSIASAKAQASA